MKVQKSTWLPALLLVYLGIMCCIGYPGYKSGQNSPAYYFGVILLTLFIIFLLRLFLLKREKMRKNDND